MKVVDNPIGREPHVRIGRRMSEADSNLKLYEDTLLGECIIQVNVWGGEYSVSQEIVSSYAEEVPGGIEGWFLRKLVQFMVLKRLGFEPTDSNDHAILWRGEMDDFPD